MPLPPAPTKRAAMLPPEAFDAPARSSHKAARKSERGGRPTVRNTRRPRTSSTRAPEAAAACRPAASTWKSRPTWTSRSGRKKKDLTVPSRRPRRRSPSGLKMFVLDTNVLMHDPMSLFRFDEHDIFLPMVVLEELDGHKKDHGSRPQRPPGEPLARRAGRQPGTDIVHGLKLKSTGTRRPAAACSSRPCRCRLTGLPMGLPQGKADNQILSVVQAMAGRAAARLLVSKDINMRVEGARAGPGHRGLQERQDAGRPGPDVLGFRSPCPRTSGPSTARRWRAGSPGTPSTHQRADRAQPVHQPVRLLRGAGRAELYARVTEIRGKTAVLKTLKDYGT